MELKTLTWDDFKQYDPCYDPHERYGDWQGTIIDLLNRDDIPAQDRIWAACHILDDKTLRLFAVYCARDVQHLMNDKRSLNALDVAEKYAIGQATDDELDAARAAAWDAAMAAARAAAWAAAWDAQIKRLILMIQNA